MDELNHQPLTKWAPGGVRARLYLGAAGPDVIEGVAAALADFDRKRGVARQELMAHLGVSAEMGLYQRMEL